MKGFIRKDIIGLCRLRTILVSLLFFFTLFTAKAIAVDYYWTATDDGSVKNWSHSQNWSNASGNSISGYPDGTNDNAIFEDAAADVLVDVYARIGKLTTKNNFTGTINVNGNILNPQKDWVMLGEPYLFMKTQILEFMVQLHTCTTVQL